MHKCRHVVSTNFNGRFVGLWCWWVVRWLVRLTCLAAFALTLLVCLFACRRKKETTARAGDPCNAAQHCRCHPVGLQQKVAATHAVNHIGPHPAQKVNNIGPRPEPGFVTILTLNCASVCINATDFRNAIGIWKVRARPTPRPQPT